MPDPAATPGRAAVPDRAGTAADARQRPPVVDFPRTLRRLRWSLSTIGALVLLGWLVGGAVGDGWSARLLAELLGLGVMASFVVEVVVVGGSAVRGLLAAGARGDRLASADVSLLPPQLTGRKPTP